MTNEVHVSIQRCLDILTHVFRVFIRNLLYRDTRDELLFSIVIPLHRNFGYIVNSPSSRLTFQSIQIGNNCRLCKEEKKRNIAFILLAPHNVDVEAASIQHI